MTEPANPINCEQFQNRLPELIGSGADLAVDPHLQQCPICKALMADLESIADAARELFPMMEPPDAVWEQIESALKSEGAAEDRHDTRE